MQGKIILNLAISLDGYIAAENGDFDWIVGDGDNSLNTDETLDFEKFMNTIDIVVMGSQCFRQGFVKDFATKKILVATREEKKTDGNIEFIRGDIASILELEKQKGKNIYLFGGGILIDPLIKANVIDEYIIGIIPTILGTGKRLFLDNNPNLLLHLDKYTIEDGIPILYYSKR